VLDVQFEVGLLSGQAAASAPFEAAATVTKIINIASDVVV